MHFDLAMIMLSGSAIISKYIFMMNENGSGYFKEKADHEASEQKKRDEIAGRKKSLEHKVQNGELTFLQELAATYDYPPPTLEP
jgi:hypothetical protein